MLRNPGRKWVGIFLAAAASFMMAFFLGIGAQQWFEKAALRGHPRAFEALGRIYYLGHGVEQDDVMAHKWFTLADAAGDKSSKAVLEVLNGRMSEEQLSQAQQHVQDWQGERESSQPSATLPDQ